MDENTNIELRNPMSSSMRLTLILAASSVVTGFAFSQETDDLKAIQGNWDLVRIEATGIQVFPPLKEKKPSKPIPAKVTGEKLYMYDELDGTIALDSKKTPKQVNHKSKAGRLMEGIYKVEDDSLWICWADGKRGKAPRRIQDGTRGSRRAPLGTKTAGEEMNYFLIVLLWTKAPTLNGESTCPLLGMFVSGSPEIT